VGGVVGDVQLILVTRRLLDSGFVVYIIDKEHVEEGVVVRRNDTGL